MIATTKTNPKYFHKYARINSKIKSEVGPLVSEVGNLEASPQQISEILRRQYESAFSVPLPDPPENIEIPTSSFAAACDEVQISLSDIEQSVKRLRAGSSPGPDGFLASVLLNCVEQLKLPLYILYRKSIDSCEVPLAWKTAQVIPVYKKGSRSVASNYRPIALT